MRLLPAHPAALCAVVLLLAACVALLPHLLPGQVPSGPKSGAPAPDILQKFKFCGPLGDSSTKFCRSGGEGFRCAIAPDERNGSDKPPSWIPPNTHGIGKEVSRGTPRPMQAVKRSLLRAQRLAQREGWTFYKGN